ncbi:MAG: aminopeptidase [Lentimicrobium sp.]|nr:aminopeptidase [Lentimicrobium sp.]
MKKTSTLLARLLFAISLINVSLNVSGQDNEQEPVEGYKFTTIKINPASPVKDQYKSGTCWSFAATSFIESELLRLGYDTIDISEMFFVYKAYQEKAGRYVRLHGNANFGPGGQAHDVFNVVKQNGFVTEEDFPGLLKGETNHLHGELDAVLKGYLDALLSNKDGKISQVWPEAYSALLNAYMGPLPESVIKKGKSPEIVSNEKYPRFNPEEYVELTSYLHHPFYQSIDLEVPDNWSHDRYFNIPVDELIETMNYSINNGYTVCWDGDVSDRGFSHSNGVAIVPDKNVTTMEGTERSSWEKLSEKEKNAELYTFKTPGTEKKVTQEMRQRAFDNFQATDDHLMHFTGIVSDQNGTNYYITKNSWAAASNQNGGYLNISEAYARLNTIAIMVHINAIPADLKKKLKL